MSYAVAKLKDLVIPNGTSVSNILLAREAYEDAIRMLVTGEAVADGAITYTLDVTDDAEPTAGGVWRTLQILNGAALADFPLPNANTKTCALPIEALASTGMRAHSSAPVTADRTFGSAKQYLIV
jgi:hypothetical protein